MFRCLLRLIYINDDDVKLIATVSPHKHPIQSQESAIVLSDDDAEDVCIRMGHIIT